MPEEKTSSNPVVLRKRDFLLAFVVLAAALLIFLALTPKSGDLTAVVEQGGQVLYRIPLREVQSSYTIQVEGEFPPSCSSIRTVCPSNPPPARIRCACALASSSAPDKLLPACPPASLCA